MFWLLIVTCTTLTIVLVINSYMYNPHYCSGYTVDTIKKLKYCTKSAGAVRGVLKFGGEYCMVTCKCTVDALVQFGPVW